VNICSKHWFGGVRKDRRTIHKGGIDCKTDGGGIYSELITASLPQFNPFSHSLDSMEICMYAHA
jgi:hypothetical protein